MPMPAIKRELATSYDEVLEQLPPALQTEGFGVLSEIDVQATLKKKLGVDFRRYRILGACNPALANRALSSSLDVGVLLPCNVAVYETDSGTTISAVDPVDAIGHFGDDEMRGLATEVKEKLMRVLERMT